jgi:hypothetical protein
LREKGCIFPVIDRFYRDGGYSLHSGGDLNPDSGSVWIFFLSLHTIGLMPVDHPPPMIINLIIMITLIYKMLEIINVRNINDSKT